MPVNPQPSSRAELNWVQLSTLIEASHLLNATLDHDEVLRQLMALVATGVNADRATLYLLDKTRRELRSIVLLDEKLHEIRLPLEEGLAGYVARTGETVNVADAYADPRFSPRVDQEAGYQTRTVLAVPLRDPKGRINGVVQALNKLEGVFSQEDERYLLALAEQAALALESAHQYAAMVVDSERLCWLYRTGGMLVEGASPDEAQFADVLRIVIQETVDVLGAEAGAILLLDEQRRWLNSAAATPQQGEPGPRGIRVPLKGSIAGWVVQNGEGVIADAAQADPRFFSDADERTGFVSRTMVCVPLKLRGHVFGVLEVLNERGGALFDQAALQLAQAVANYVALALGPAYGEPLGLWDGA